MSSPQMIRMFGCSDTGTPTGRFGWGTSYKTRATWVARWSEAGRFDAGHPVDHGSPPVGEMVRRIIAAGARHHRRHAHGGIGLQVSQQVVAGGVAFLGDRRDLDLVRVAADRLAVSLQHLDLATQYFDVAEDVAGIRVLGHEAQRLLLAAAY